MYKLETECTARSTSWWIHVFWNCTLDSVIENSFQSRKLSIFLIFNFLVGRMLFFQFTKIILKTDEEIWCKLCIFKWGGDIAIVNYLIAYIKRRNTSSVQLTYFQSLRWMIQFVQFWSNQLLSLHWIGINQFTSKRGERGGGCYYIYHCLHMKFRIRVGMIDIRKVSWKPKNSFRQCVFIRVDPVLWNSASRLTSWFQTSSL